MLKNKENMKVPSVTFKTIVNGNFKDITSEELFSNKKVVLFSLPGAFTPTCSSTHLPRYNDLAPIFKDNGIDSIICLSVNDAFVMNAWCKDQEAQNISVIPDGNGDFTEKMGMLVDKRDIGFGNRSWRYSMLVDDGIVKKMFIEPEEPGDPFKVSDADTMLNYINPSAKPNAGITIFTKSGCPHCANAKNLLKESHMTYTEISGIKTNALKAMGGKGSYPLIFIEGKLIGGNTDLIEYLK